MMVKKNTLTLILSITIIILVLSGCVPESLKEAIKNFPGIPTPTTEEEPGLTFKGGTQGVNTKILSPTEKEIIPKSIPFTPVISLSNDGEADSEGIVCIQGLDTQIFTGFTGCDCMPFTLVVADEESEDYKEKIITFPSYTINLEEQASFPITANTKYEYKTLGIAKACIKKDIYSESGCQIGAKKNKLEKSSSAPIKINKVTETATLTDDAMIVSLKIEAEKKGEGSLHDLRKYQDPYCELGEMDKKIRAKLSNVPELGRVTCGTFELDEKGKGSISCEFEVSLFDASGNYIYTGDYQPEILIELEYAFETIKTHIFTV